MIIEHIPHFEFVKLCATTKGSCNLYMFPRIRNLGYYPRFYVGGFGKVVYDSETLSLSLQYRSYL